MNINIVIDSSFEFNEKEITVMNFIQCFFNFLKKNSKINGTYYRYRQNSKEKRGGRFLGNKINPKS